MRKATTYEPVKDFAGRSELVNLSIGDKWVVLGARNRIEDGGRHLEFKLECSVCGLTLFRQASVARRRGNKHRGLCSMWRRKYLEMSGGVPASRHPLYDIWKNIISRCYNPANRSYPDYGGRGIDMDPRWRADFYLFAVEVMDGYSRGLVLDRRDNNLGYWPKNVWWVTPAENSRNKRNSVYLTLYGRPEVQAVWVTLYCEGQVKKAGGLNAISGDTEEVRWQMIRCSFFGVPRAVIVECDAITELLRKNGSWEMADIVASRYRLPKYSDDQIDAAKRAASGSRVGTRQLKKRNG